MLENSREEDAYDKADRALLSPLFGTSDADVTVASSGFGPPSGSGLGPPKQVGDLASLDRFSIVRQIGEGGMGLVYLARDPAAKQEVAIKLMNPRLVRDPSSVHRFLTEAKHMSRLSHPNILKVHEICEKEDGPYYVMPFLPRGSLAGLLQPRKPLDATTTIQVAIHVAEALSYAHDHGIIHRDLKPANVLLGEDNLARLSDFGLVRTVFNDSLVDVRESHCEGTAAYMSPAVAGGAAEDTRCDIYSFGAMLYEMLTGNPPYSGDSTQQMLRKILAGPPELIRKLNPQAPAGLVKIAEAAMARELRDRYAKMDDVLADLQRVAKGRPPVGPHGSVKGTSATGWGIAASLAILAIGGASMLKHFGSPTTHGVSPVSALGLNHGHDAQASIEYSAASFGVQPLAPSQLHTRIDADGHRVVDLMPLIDPDRDALKGSWRMIKGVGLSSDETDPAKLRIPYDPPDEYDFRVEFTRVTGNQGVLQIGRDRAIQFAWVVGAQNSSMIGFLREPAPRVATYMPGLLMNGPVGVSVVQVRKQSVTGLFGDQKVLHLDTDLHDLRAMGALSIGGTELGVGSQNSSTVFHKIEVVEISGPGTAWPHARDNPAPARVLKTNCGPVIGVDYSRDGKLLLSRVDLPNTCRQSEVWDAETGRHLLAKECDSKSVSLSPDSRHLIVGQPWCIADIYTGQTLVDLADQPATKSVAFSPDGSWAIFGCMDGTIHVVNVTSFSDVRETQRLAGAVEILHTVAFSPDSTRIVSGTEHSGRISLWDLKAAKELWDMSTGDKRTVEILGFNRSGTQIMETSGGGGSRTAFVLDAKDGRIVRRFEHVTALTDVRFSADGRYLITADHDVGGGLHLWELSSGQEIPRFAVGPVNGLAVSHDGTRLLAACEDWTVRLFDFARGKELCRCAGHDKRVRSVAFSPDDKMAASGSDDRTVRLWRLPDVAQKLSSHAKAD